MPFQPHPPQYHNAHFTHLNNEHFIRSPPQHNLASTMIATGFYPQHFHMPSRPSPLSERSANATPHPFQFSMPMPAQTDQKSLTALQRAYKPNPVVQTRDAATKRRRDMFFKRVQRDREDKKWEARGEQVRVLCGEYSFRSG